MIDGFGAQLVVPGLVAVDLAQAVLGAVLGQPRRGIGGPDVDRVPRHVRRRLGGGDPAGSLLLRAVLRDRLLQQLFLVLRGTPAAVDDELDAVVRGSGCSSAQGAEEIGVEVGYARNLVVEDRRAGRDGTVGLAQRARCAPTDRRAAGDGTVGRPGTSISALRRTPMGDAAVEDEDASDW